VKIIRIFLFVVLWIFLAQLDTVIPRKAVKTSSEKILRAIFDFGIFVVKKGLESPIYDELKKAQKWALETKNNIKKRGKETKSRINDALNIAKITASEVKCYQNITKFIRCRDVLVLTATGSTQKSFKSSLEKVLDFLCPERRFEPIIANNPNDDFNEEKIFAQTHSFKTLEKKNKKTIPKISKNQYKKITNPQLNTHEAFIISDPPLLSVPLKSPNKNSNTASTIPITNSKTHGIDRHIPIIPAQKRPNCEKYDSSFNIPHKMHIPVKDPEIAVQFQNRNKPQITPCDTLFTKGFLYRLWRNTENSGDATIAK